MKDDFDKAVKDQDLNGWLIALNHTDLVKAIGLISDEYAADNFDLLNEFECLDTSGFNRRQFLIWSMVFDKTFPVLDIEARKALCLTNNFLKLFDSPSDYHLRGGFKGWLENNPTQCPQVFRLILDEGQDSDLMYLCLDIWRKYDQPPALTACLSIVESEYKSIRQGAIRLMGLFEFSEIAEKDQMVTVLCSLAQGDIEEDAMFAVTAMSHLLEKSVDLIAEFTEVLSFLCSEPTPSMCRELIRNWAMRPQAFPEGISASILGLMATLPNNTPENAHFLDSYLSQFDFEKEQTRSILTRLLTLESDSYTLVELDSVSYALSNLSSEIKSKYVLDWLLSGDPRLGHSAAKLYPSLNNDLIEFSLDGFTLSDADYFYLTKKVFAYLFYSYGAAVSILSALLSSTTGNTQKELTSFISGFWLRNFPHDIDSFAACAKKNPTLTAPLRTMKKSINSYLTGTANNEINMALRPSDNERRIRNEIKYNKDKHMRSSVHENSWLGSLATAKHILYGSSMTSYIHGNADDPPVRQEIPIQTHTMSGYLPRMSIFCPARLDYLFIQFRMAQRPE